MKSWGRVRHSGKRCGRKRGEEEGKGDEAALFNEVGGIETFPKLEDFGERNSKCVK